MAFDGYRRAGRALACVGWLFFVFLSVAGKEVWAFSVTAGPAMTTARTGHHAIRLASGRVLLIGGHGQGFTPLGRNELANSGMTAFSSLGSQNHDGACVARLSNGNLLIAGSAGSSGASSFPYADVFDPVAESFATTAGMVKSRSNCAAAGLSNGQALVLGGWYSDSAGNAELYRTATGSFSLTGSLVAPRAIPLLVPTQDGRALVIGGMNPNDYSYHNSVEIFSTATNAFSPHASAIFAGETDWRVRGVPIRQENTLSDGRILHIALRTLTSTSDLRYTLFTVNPATLAIEKLTTTPALPGGIYWLDPVVDTARNRAYLVGVPAGSAGSAAVFYSVDLATSSLSGPQPLNLATGVYLIGSSLSVLSDGRILLAGGTSRNDAQTNFNPIGNTWLITPDTGTPPASQSFNVTATASGGDENLTLTAQMTLASEHIGRTGEIYVAASLGNQWFFNNGSNWQTSTLPYFRGPLPASRSIPVISGMNLAGYGGLGIYAGYGLDLGEMVGAGRYRKLYTVTGGNTGGGDPFATKPLQPGVANTETKTISLAAGQRGTLTLSDGTKLALPAANVSVTASVELKANTLDLSRQGVAISGSMREVTIQPGGELSAYRLVLSIPAGEYGAINPDTLNVARIGDIAYNGQIRSDMVVFLPVRRTTDGTLTIDDPYLSQGGANAFAAQGPKRIRYVLTTFQGDLNWSEAPRLVRMVPRPADSARRVPLSTLSASEQSAETGKCAQNFVVLVHGHNEDEKDGYTGKEQIGAPWRFSYKRDVWTALYENYDSNYQAYANNACTLFYEYIYPSYRPIFAGGGNLSKDFADQLARELAPSVAAGLKPNLFIVAHSMGGLVARAGIQKMSSDMHTAFQRLATWGTPHRGSVLSSLRYVCGGPYSPQSGAGPLWDATSYFCASQQLDMPGARDLRWDNARPLAFSRYFDEDTNDGSFDLANGAWLYSENIRALNAGDVYAGTAASRNRLNQKKYAFLYGITSKGPSSMIGLGASMTKTFIDRADQEFLNGRTLGASDGAVPISSMVADGIDGERVFLGDIDHEEYFNGQAKAVHTAEVTQTYLRLGDGTYACPPEIASLSPQSGEVGASVTVTGTGFGTTTGTVTFNGVAATVSSWSSTRIVTNVPTGASSGDVIVKHGVNGKQSKGKPFTVTSAPTQTGKYSCTENTTTAKLSCREYAQINPAQAAAIGQATCPATGTDGVTTWSTGNQWAAASCARTGVLGICQGVNGYYGVYDSYHYDASLLAGARSSCRGTWKDQ